jgi:hypothetical protein
MKENDLLSKLERVERTLSIFNNNSNDLLQELEVKVPLGKLKLIVIPKVGDDELYLPYVLDELQLKRLNELMGHAIKPDFQKNYYVLEANGVYNW